MSIRLVRESSNTPNVTNRDDARMVNYAYGGYEGIVKDVGAELAYTTEGGIFKIGSGRVVLQGWEVDVGVEGWELDLSSVNGTFFYTIYLEINLATEEARILSTYGEVTYPQIGLGDNLTSSPSGLARMPLFKLTVSDGVIQEVVQDVEVMKHIRERLEELGFKEGDIWEAECIDESGNSLGFVAFENSINPNDPPVKLMKQGKIALMLDMHIHTINIVTTVPPSGTSTLRFNIPKAFFPKEYSISFLYKYESGSNSKLATAQIYKKGDRFVLDFPYSFGAFYTAYNIGWRIE